MPLSGILCISILVVGGGVQDSSPTVGKFDAELGIVRYIKGRSSQAKIRIYYTRAAFISNALGGTILPSGSDRPQEFARIPPIGPLPSSGSAGALLPDGIEAVIANERDNTLMAIFTDEDALIALARVVRGIDVRQTRVRVRARALIVVTDRSGGKKQMDFVGEGVVSGERRIQLKTSSDGADSRLGMPASCTSDADIYASVLNDGTIDVSAEWYVDVAWKTDDPKKPVRLRNVFRASGSARSGITVPVTHSTLRIPSGVAELTLVVTPWAIWDRQGAPSSH
jgi:hypothetical protein